MQHRHSHKRKPLSTAEAEGLRLIRPALGASLDDVRAAALSALRRGRPSRSLVDGLPWKTAGQRIVAAWLPFATDRARRAARAAQRVKQQDSSEDAIVSAYARTNAGTLATQANDTTRRGMLAILEEAAARGWDDKRTAEALVDWAGVGPAEAKGLVRQADLLAARETPGSTIRRTLAARAQRAVRLRAEAMAITEANATESGASVAMWRAMEGRGQIAPGAEMEWETFDPCEVCDAIARQGPVPLGELFYSPLQGVKLAHPPAHPRCRCRPRLIPKPF